MTSPTTSLSVTTGTDQITLVNVFTVDIERQTELVEALDEATRSIFTKVPGFISANLHVSLDGTRVVNYAQWADKASYSAALQHPEVRKHVEHAAGIAQAYDPTLVQVWSVHNSDADVS
ncbi:antibiotic biosynthesis monooxygenase family protein [Streptomyces malaysiensis]|uniref:Antibiotic biosynthesis monooxygenase n=1 Tax=Streptomyces malaysiensis subsp. samsunensis TaxID=459658 RepID=A0A9X2LYT0_STRMQ|nr:antibiotic biosynthesis monooxygenase family protein [Streptomyces samsunensis]MCQ8832177.1 antibiotic biosynthesis monooxygenase [Streptomyces samsunensis]